MDVDGCPRSYWAPGAASGEEIRSGWKHTADTPNQGVRRSGWKHIDGCRKDRVRVEVGRAEEIG